MWVDNTQRKPNAENNYPVRRKAGNGTVFDDVCAWIPNRFTRRTKGSWFDIRHGWRLGDILEWWEDDHHD